MENFYNTSQIKSTGLCKFLTRTQILHIIWRTLCIKQRCSLRILHILHSNMHFKIQSTSAKLTLGRYTENKPHLIVLSLHPTHWGSGREGRRKKRTTVLALTHLNLTAATEGHVSVSHLKFWKETSSGRILDCAVFRGSTSSHLHTKRNFFSVCPKCNLHC